MQLNSISSLTDARDLFAEISVHTALEDPEDREADLAGRLSCVLSDPVTPAFTRRFLEVWVTKEKMRNALRQRQRTAK